MKTTTERTADNTAVLTIEIEDSDQNKILERGYKRVANRVNIPGFRPGKAPRPLVERFVGKETILQEGLEGELSSILRQAMTEADIRPYGQPEVDFESMEPLTLKVTVALWPEVELGDYSDQKIPRSTVVVESSDIDTQIDSIRERFATYEDITNRGIKWGDQVTLDMVSFPTDEPDKAGEPQEMPYRVDPESNYPFPRFADNIIDMKQDETREFTYTYPNEERHGEQAGKDYTFRVTLKSIKEKHLPELDDELAKSEGRFQTLDELREAVAGEIQTQRQSEEERRIEDAVLAAVAQQSNVNIPAKMVDAQVDSMLEDRLNIYTMFGLPKPSLEQYTNSIGRSEEELRNELRPQARERLVNALILQKVAETENVEVTDEEIESEINNIAARAGQNAAQVRRRYRDEDERDSVRFRLRQNKTLKMLVERISPPDSASENSGTPLASMLLGGEQSQPGDEPSGMVRTGSGLVVPGRARLREEQPAEAAASASETEAAADTSGTAGSGEAGNNDAPERGSESQA